MTTTIKTPELLALLESHYAPEKWAFLPQVPNGTASHKTRTADAIVMGLWPSSGLNLMGFELKVSRADWRKEMEDHHKADAFSKHCDFWFLVAPKEVAKLEELPTGWGWLTPKNGKLVTLRGPTRNPNPVPINREFLAGLCRVLHRKKPGVAELQAADRTAFERGWKAGHTEGQKAAERKDRSALQDAERERGRLQQAIDEFESRSGIRIREYSGEQLGAAVTVLQRFGLDRLRQAADRLFDEHSRSAERWRATVQEIDKVLSNKEAGHELDELDELDS